MFLRDIIVNTKTVKIDFPGLKGFEVEVAAVSREVSKKLRTESEITKIDSKLKMPITEIDEDKFLEKFAGAAIKGWKGLKFGYLGELLLIDETKIDDVEAEVEYNTENVIELLKHSQIFEAWINEQVFSIDRFRNK